MDELTLQQTIQTFIEGLSSPTIPHWDALPDLELYMDQVIVFMEKYLALFGDGRDKLITPSMINNYVKLGIIPPPVKKKYNREHLAQLMAICMLKQILPIPVLSSLTGRFAEQSGLPKTFDLFVDEQCTTLRHAAQTAHEAVEQLEPAHLQEGLAQLSLKLAAQANACRILADKIALLLVEGQPAAPKDKK